MAVDFRYVDVHVTLDDQIIVAIVIVIVIVIIIIIIINTVSLIK